MKEGEKERRVGEDSPYLRERKISERGEHYGELVSERDEIAFTKRSVALINVACHGFAYP